ncbi:hypothetical protein SK854_01580 [Lentzea sp. BCCO 10_0061]|uniref:Secreted protein n=1 Tax=Lentzea sokolovensis TaxID=3095429 RepID=A0ABU4UMR7_9PSEU|nr:hypothetical protein [Lentzea sp. BCCO 10_0061]MDX8140783.1 hypothetical protein [Lentzea sp. BCCO 10_0061]
MIAVVSAAVVVLSAHVAEASPPPGCQAACESYDQERQAGYGRSEGNSGIQRLVLSCIDPYTLFTYARYGSWVASYQQPTAYCAVGHSAFGADVQR